MTSDNILILKNAFEFPDCWKNDLRMGALFAPFRSKNINPNDHASKIKFWADLIESWCKYNKSLIIDVDTLKSNFSRNGKVPACLDDVIQMLKSGGVIISKDDFISSNASWKEWAVKLLVTNPLKWTFNSVKETLIGKCNRGQIEYIHLPVLQFLGKNLVKHVLSSSQDKLVRFDDLLEMEKIDNPESLSLILQWLLKEGSVAVCKENNHILVKVSKTGVKPIKITDIDKGIWSLERQEKILEDNIKKLESDKNTVLEETRKLLANNMKIQAKVLLRKKQAIEKAIEKRLLLLNNLQTLLHRINQAELEGDIVECYQTGIVTLKTLFKETGLNKQNVLSTMEELNQTINSGKEIEEALSQPLDSDLQRNLEEELNEILLENAPDVPTEIVDVKSPEKNKVVNTTDLHKKMEAF